MVKVFLTSLSAYSTCLVGQWISLPLEENDLNTVIQQVLRAGEKVLGEKNHDEYFITDWEWDDIPLFPINEYVNIHSLNQQITLIDESIEEAQHTSLKLLLEYGLVNDLEEALEKVDEVFSFGVGTSFEDIAYDYVNDSFDLDSLPAIIAGNICYKSIGIELQSSGEYYEMDNEIFQLFS